MTIEQLATDTVTLEDTVQMYRELGLLPFPVCKPTNNGRCFQHGKCTSPGKVPLLPSWTNLKRDERCNKGLNELFKKQEKTGCNIGLLCGIEGNLVVLDVDGEEGFTSLDECGLGFDGEANQAECYSGAIITTGRIGGVHYWYSPGNQHLSKRIGFQPKLDFIGEGGFVLAPPSVHSSGNVYSFRSIEMGSLPVIPDWMIEIISAANDRRTNIIDLPLKDDSKVGIGQRTLTFLSSGAINAQREEMINAIVNMLGRGIDGNEVIRRVSHALIDLSPQLNEIPWTEKDVVKAVYDFEKKGIKAPRGIDNDHTLNFGKKKDNSSVTSKAIRITDALNKFRNEEEQEWLIEGIIHEGEFLWFFAPPNAGKTFVAMDWAMHVSSGRKYQEYLNVRRGKVLIIEQDRQLDPIRYLEAHLDGGDWKVEDIEENLYITSDSDFTLSDAAGLVNLLSYIDNEKPKLVIMDACYKFCSNGTVDTDYSMVHKFKEAMVSRGVAVIMLDHSIATPELTSLGSIDASGMVQKENERGHLDKLYGGQAKRKILDTGLYMKGYLKDGKVRLCWAKVQGAQPDDWILEFTPREGFKAKVNYVKEKHPWSKIEIAVVEFISRHGPSDLKEISKSTGYPERALRRCLSAMYIRKQVMRGDDERIKLGESIGH